VPGAAARAIGGTLSGAVSTAGQLPRPNATVILESARAAFSGGLDTAAGVSAAIMVALAVVAAVRLRRVTAPDEADGTETTAVTGADPARGLCSQPCGAS